MKNIDILLAKGHTVPAVTFLETNKENMHLYITIKKKTGATDSHINEAICDDNLMRNG